MKWLIFTVVFLIWQSNPNLKFADVDCKICGEYSGGRAFYSWTTLTLKPNGKYTFSESRHTMQSIEDEGKWQLKDKILILNSTSKTVWKSPRKSKAKKKFFFQNQKCDIDGNSILIRKEKDEGFNLAYYSLMKIEDKKEMK